MSALSKHLKRYRVFIAMFFVNALFFIYSPVLGVKSLIISRDNLFEMLSVVPPIFILLGLLDVWVEREVMIRHMGEGSGFKGGVLAFFLGSAAAGPLYASFPIAGLLLKKGARLSNVFIFIGAWSTTKLPMLLFEASNLGIRYMALRLFFNVIGIVAIAVILEKRTPENEKKSIYEGAQLL